MTYVAGDIFLLSLMKIITIVDKTSSTLTRTITFKVDAISYFMNYDDTLHPNKKVCIVHFKQGTSLQLEGEATDKFLAVFNAISYGEVDKNLTIWQKIKIFCSHWLFSLRLNKLSTPDLKSNRSDEKGQI